MTIKTLRDELGRIDLAVRGLEDEASRLRTKRNKIITEIAAKANKTPKK